MPIQSWNECKSTVHMRANSCILIRLLLLREWLNPRSHFLQIATTEKWTSVQLKSSHLFLCRHFAAMAYLAEKMLEVLHVMSAGEKTESTNVFNTIGQVGALSTCRAKPTYARMHMTLSFISMEPLEVVIPPSRPLTNPISNMCDEIEAWWKAVQAYHREMERL